MVIENAQPPTGPLQGLVRRFGGEARNETTWTKTHKVSWQSRPLRQPKKREAEKEIKSEIEENVLTLRISGRAEEVEHDGW